MGNDNYNGLVFVEILNNYASLSWHVLSVYVRIVALGALVLCCIETMLTELVVIELGVRKHFCQKCSLTKPNSLTTFHQMEIILWITICILFS